LKEGIHFFIFENWSITSDVMVSVTKIER